MAYPDGVTLATVNVGSVIDFFGANATVEAKVTPVLAGAATRLIHAATGIVMVTTTKTFTGTSGGEAVLTMPHSDSAGWLDPSLQPAPEWAYLVEVTARDATGKATPWAKTIRVPSSHAEPWDFDLMPSLT